jgi:hypothetical protein
MSDLKIQHLLYFEISSYFRYIPSAYVKEGLDLSDEIAKKEVNNLNIELVHKLKDTDSAFSLGK